MVEEATHKWMSDGVAEKWSRNKAIGVIVIVEIFAIGLLASDYAIIATLLGHPRHRDQLIHLSKTDLNSYIIIAPFIGAMYYANAQLLSKERIAYFKNIFHTWNKQKRGWWKAAVLLIGAFLFVLFIIVGGVAANLIQP
jgi:hypothetical protein